MFLVSATARHYRKPRVRRVLQCLPCAFPRAHGEHNFCRAPRTKHMANRKHTANRDFAVCTRPDTRRIKTSPCAHQTAHGEMGSTLMAVRCSSTPSAFAVCPQPSTRRTFIFVVCLGAAHGEVMAPLTDPNDPWTSSPLPCAGVRHTADVRVCRVLLLDTWQRRRFAVC